MKATLEFDLPEDNDDHHLAVKGSNYWCSLLDLDNWLRGLVKYGELSDEEASAYDKCRDELREIMCSHGVGLDDVS